MWYNFIKIMGVQGRSFEYKELRDKDLMRAYREQIASQRNIHLPDVLRQTVNSPSQRFWVSDTRANIIMSRLRKGDSLPEMNGNKKRMFLEIYRRVCILSEEYPDMSLSELTSIVVEQPAPCFYITPQSAKVIIHKIKKKWLEERKKKLRFMF